MAKLILTPARVPTGAITTIAGGWIKSLEVAARVGWLRGRARSARLRAHSERLRARSAQLRARSARFRVSRPRVVSVRGPELAAAVIAGASAEYLLDPTDGKRRRHMLRDRGASLGRRLARRSAAQARYVEGKAEGAVHDATSSPGAPADDHALADRVRTEIFRRPDAPKGSVNVSALDAIVYLRGEVDTAEQIDQLISEARQVPGVRAVESLLHTPGTPAPMGGAA